MSWSIRAGACGARHPQSWRRAWGRGKGRKGWIRSCKVGEQRGEELGSRDVAIGERCER